MGGWAPYFSLAGMLRSSTNTTTFLPMAGPYTPRFRLQKEQSRRLVADREGKNNTSQSE